MPGDGPVGQNGNDDRFAELSAILIGPERGALAELQQRLDSPEKRAADVAAVLAEAVRLRVADPKLRKALQPAIEEAIGVSVRRNPRVLADLLFPIFKKAMRKAIGAELDGMMQSLSQVLEQSLSWRSLQWRMEAIRSNKRYAEIVLLRSMLYRVEQVFLIHRKTGLLLLHAETALAAMKDPEMISGMLTAIQDFVRDSMTGAEDEDLETVRVGEFTVVMAYGPQAILAGFVRGVVPRTLNRLFQDEVDSIHEELGPALASFNGDTTKFAVAQPHLERCLVGAGDPALVSAGVSRGAKLLVWSIPVMLLALLVGWTWYAARAERRWRGLVERMAAQPGIVITETGRRGGKYFVTGFRDPLAGDPAALAREAGVPADRVEFHWEGYYSLQPAFVAEREYRAAKQHLEKHAVRFRLASARIEAEQQFLVNETVEQIGALFDAAGRAGHAIRLEVLGGTDPLGSDELNAKLAQDRAGAVQAALIAAGIQRDRLPARGLNVPCALAASQDTTQCRSAIFRVLEGGK